MAAYTLDMEELGHRLRDQRKRQHLTQTALARLAEVDLSNISELERGVRRSVSLPFIYAVCEVLNCDIDYLTRRAHVPRAHHACGCDDPSWQPFPAPG